MIVIEMIAEPAEMLRYETDTFYKMVEEKYAQRWGKEIEILAMKIVPKSVSENAIIMDCYVIEQG